jgi:hypothetical protein
LAIAALLSVSAIAPAKAANCTVADPTGTPLNVRAEPSGTILGRLRNGTRVEVTDVDADARMKAWAYVVPQAGKSGWVILKYLVKCDRPVG